MRLTLRTLLAYMDDILDPADHEDLGRKIEASDFASELIHRSRDTVRRLRLGAPAVLAGRDDDVLGESDSSDANAVAEYLDNTLPPEHVAEFERMCLEPGNEPDMHLAEVASCHHVLTMVLGEPAEVDSDLKARMYQLPSQQSTGQKLRIEPAHVAPTAVPQESAVAVSVTPEQSTAGRHLPDYLREAAATSRRRRRRMVAVALFAGVGGLAYYFAPEPPVVVPQEIAEVDIESLEAGDIKIEGMDDMSIDMGSVEGSPKGYVENPAPHFQPSESVAPLAEDDPLNLDQQTKEPDASESVESMLAVTSPEEMASTEAAVPVETELPEKSITESPAEEPLPAAVDPVTEKTLSDVDDLEKELKKLDTEVVPPVSSVADEGPLLVPDFDRPQANGPGNSEMAADAIQEDPTLVASLGGAVENPGEAVVPTEEASAGPRRLGSYPGGDNNVLLLHDEETDKWGRLASRSPIATGDTLLVLPKFRTHLVLSDVQMNLWGGTQLYLPVKSSPSTAASNELSLEVVYGRMSIAAGLNGNDIALQVGEQMREFRLANAANLVVDVQRVFIPGSDYENQAAPIRATWYLIEGSVEWPTASGGKQTIESPATWQTIDGIDEIPEPVTQLPEWIDREPMTDTERDARNDLDAELQAGQPVGIRLLELTDGKGLGRRSEVRILAAASSLYVGEFEPLVKALDDKKQKRAWKTHVNDLRQAMALSPNVASRVRQAFVNVRGEEAADDLMAMVIGYNSEQIGQTPEEVRQGALAQMIKWLDHSSLDYRVLAFHNFREITGKPKGYHPDGSSKRRTIDYRKIWKAFEANELMPKS